MNVTKDGFKDRQLHMEDYLQMVSAEQKEYTERYVQWCGRSAAQLMGSLLPDIRQE